MASKSKGGTLNATLERALADELTEIMKKNGDGSFVHNALERCRIIDRCLKWESVKQKLENPEWGKEFDK